jgi:acyl-CoA thioesterase
MDMIALMKERDRFARLAGIEALEVDADFAKVRMVIADCHRNALDMVHGGAIFSLADYAFALASNAVAPPSVALSVSIQFLRPGKEGTLYATARLQSQSGRVGTYLVEVKDDAGEMIASFQGLAFCKASSTKSS